MSHKRDKERAKNNLIFRDGRLVQKPVEPPPQETPPQEIPEEAPIENLPPTQYEDYFNPGNYCVLPSHGTEHCQERYCHDCPKHLSYRKNLGKQ